MARITATENSKEELFSLNEDGSLSLSVIKEKIPGVIGLRYRFKGRLRAVRICSNYFFLPIGISWDKDVFHCVYDENLELEDKKEVLNLSTYYDLLPYDMIVMGLPDNIESNEFNTYFSQFGKLSICELKKDSKTGRSKGYGFLKYINFDDQYKCISSELKLKDTEVHLRLPTYHLDESICERRILITNITPSVTMIDLLEYFNVFGKISEIFMPNALVPYAFVTFVKNDAVVNVFKFGESHRVFGGFVFVERLKSKKELEDAQHRKDPSEYKNKKPDDARVKALTLEGTLSNENDSKLISVNKPTPLTQPAIGSESIQQTNLAPPPLTFTIDRTCPPPIIQGTRSSSHFTGPPPMNLNGFDGPPQFQPISNLQDPSQSGQPLDRPAHMTQMSYNQNNFDGSLPRNQDMEHQSHVDRDPSQNSSWGQLQRIQNFDQQSNERLAPQCNKQINFDSPPHLNQQFIQQNNASMVPQFNPQFNYDGSLQVVQSINGSLKINPQFNHQMNFEGQSQVAQSNGTNGTHVNYPINFEGQSQGAQQSSGVNVTQFNHLINFEGQSQITQQNNGQNCPQFNYPNNFEGQSQIVQQNNGQNGPQFNYPINFEGQSQMIQQNNGSNGTQFNHQINFESQSQVTQQFCQQSNGPMGLPFHPHSNIEGIGHKVVCTGLQTSYDGALGNHRQGYIGNNMSQGYNGSSQIVDQHGSFQMIDIVPQTVQQISNQFKNFDTIPRMVSQNYHNNVQQQFQSQTQCDTPLHIDQQSHGPNIIQGAPPRPCLPQTMMSRPRPQETNQPIQFSHNGEPWGWNGQVVGTNPQFVSQNNQPLADSIGWDGRPVSAPQVHNNAPQIQVPQIHQSIVINDPTHRRTNSAELRSPTTAYNQYCVDNRPPSSTPQPYNVSASTLPSSNGWNVPHSSHQPTFSMNNQMFQSQGQHQMNLVNSPLSSNNWSVPPSQGHPQGQPYNMGDDSVSIRRQNEMKNTPSDDIRGSSDQYQDQRSGNNRTIEELVVGTSNSAKDQGEMLPLQLVSDVTMRLLKTCNSEAEKKILAKLLLSVMSDPAAAVSETAIVDNVPSGNNPNQSSIIDQSKQSANQ